MDRKTVAQEERSGTKASGTCTTRTVSMAPAPVVEYIAPTPAVPLCCCKGQMKGGSGRGYESGIGSFASKYQPPSFEGEDEKWKEWARVFRSWSGRFYDGELGVVYDHIESKRNEPVGIGDLPLSLVSGREEKLRAMAFEIFHVLVMLTRGRAQKLVLKAAESDLQDGTCADQGYTHQTGTQTKSYPIIGDLTKDHVSKTVSRATEGKWVPTYMHHQLAEHDHLALDSLGDLEQGADVPAPSLGKALADVTKLVETQEKAEALPRPTRPPPWRDKLETCQSGVKSEKYLEHEASIPGRK